MAIQAQLVTSDQRNFGFSNGPHDSIMETGAGFHHPFLIPQQQQQQQQLMMQFVPFQNFQTSFLKDFFTQSLSSQIEKQRMEMDRLIGVQVKQHNFISFVGRINLVFDFIYISHQNERLRQALQEQRETHISILMNRYDSNIRSLLRQKDEEISKATDRRMELENLLRRMEIEKQTWQMAAKEKEAMAASLNCEIRMLRETACLSINAAEDAESCCENVEQDTRKMMICRCCASRKACVIMLPCRHLCSCKDCEPFLDSCPVCKMQKKASLEALTHL
ncbi:hypothetical protein F511_01098 [Dorcoceras hygrometricum]|uniref:RING-type domain-containing protein n=1 Tax=Dorcoceras hygrometricum TaxID=472368 RepID=A0A2Z7AM14_9LAMI|nr:hypothetical protein F511_01098 [Dorcoceras hygrometricum]